MAQRPLPSPEQTARREVEAVNEALRKGYRPAGAGGKGPAAIVIAGEALGIKRATFQNRLTIHKRDFGLEPDWSLYRATEATIREIAPATAATVGADDLISLLRKGPARLDEIAGRLNVSRGNALLMIEEAQASGASIHEFGDRWSIEKNAVPAYTSGSVEYVSRADNTFKFGFSTDQHLGSKYERLDVLNDLYDRFAKAKVDRVFNAGNWIDGEARFNKFDIHVHGMDQQLAYLAKHYPQRKGLTTYAVSGDDHEGWYAQREGVNIGRRAEHAMHDAGRSDWVDLGYMEAHIKLVNANTGESSILALVHPGGGSAYATSYSIQKIIESLDGGEKPAVGLYGHYHKLWAGNIRNVWCVQGGCTKDQDTFMRKKRIEAHVGGVIVELEQDPKTGAIIACTPQLIRYFNKGYYDGRWSHSGPVTLPERDVA